MKQSHDPIHDYCHVARVAAHAERLSEQANLNTKQKQALVLAAWWHDISRTITKKPSFVWMPLCDDTLSACMLWKATTQSISFHSATHLAIRIIFCKSFGAGKLFSKILIRKKDRVLLSILRDADKLDLLYPPRMIPIMQLADTSKIYKRGYKIILWWFLGKKQLYMNTRIAKKQAAHDVEYFLSWFRTPSILSWHKKQFGTAWVEKRIASGHTLLQHMNLQ